MTNNGYSGPVAISLMIVFAGILGYYQLFYLSPEEVALEESGLQEEMEEMEEQVFGPEKLEGIEPTVELILLASSSSILKNNWFLTAEGGLNPTIEVKLGDVVQITLINDEDIEHSIVIDDFGVNSKNVGSVGDEVTQTFVADKVGTFTYYCRVPGHSETGMEGKLIVSADR